MTVNCIPEARIRFTITSGEGPLGSDKGSSGPTMTVLAAPLPVYETTEKVSIAPWKRNEFGAMVGVKTVSYAENVVALNYAKSHGSGEAIFGNTRGELCEGTGTNIFLVMDDTCITPPLESGCLAGVTRGLVLETGRKNGLALQETALPLQCLSTVQEAFLTSTTREVHPISHVNGEKLRQSPGPISLRLAELFRQLVRDDLDP